MRHRALLAISAATLASLTTMVATTVGGAAASSTGQRHWAKVCGAPAASNAACRSLVRTDAADKPAVTTTPTGLGPTRTYGPSTPSAV